VYTEKKFESKAFPISKMMTSRQSRDFPARVLLKHIHVSEMTGDCRRFKFLRRSVDGKHLMRFQRENTVFQFLRRSVA